MFYKNMELHPFNNEPYISVVNFSDFHYNVAV